MSEQEMIVKNMSFKAGQTLTLIGVPLPDASHFAVNIGPDEKDLALHMNPRFNAHGDERAVVYNSFLEGSWGAEHREGGFPFIQGESFKITITLSPEEFLVVLTDGSEIHFPNRPGATKYNVIKVEADVRITSIEIK